MTAAARQPAKGKDDGDFIDLRDDDDFIDLRDDSDDEPGSSAGAASKPKAAVVTKPLPPGKPSAAAAACAIDDEIVISSSEDEDAALSKKASAAKTAPAPAEDVWGLYGPYGDKDPGADAMDLDDEDDDDEDAAGEEADEDDGHDYEAEGYNAAAAAAAAAAVAAAKSRSQMRSHGHARTRMFKLPPSQRRAVRQHLFPVNRFGQPRYPPAAKARDGAKIVGQWAKDGVTYAHLQSLAPGAWCRDEVMNFMASRLNYLNKLATPDFWRKLAAEQASAGAAAGGAGGSAPAVLSPSALLPGFSDADAAAAAARLAFERPTEPAAADPTSTAKSFIDGHGAHGGPVPVYVWNSFFVAKLMQGGYAYQDMKRWTRRAGLLPRLTSVRYWIFPVHIDVHWALAVLDTSAGHLHYFDSMASPAGAGASSVNAADATLRAIIRWWSDETADKLGEARRVDTSSWGFTRHPAPAVPQQRNGFDCGMFMMHFARCIALGRRWDFSQADMPDLRQRLVWEIVSAGPTGGPPSA